MKYDLFFVSRYKIHEDQWKEFKERFPLAQKLEDINSLEQIKKKSFTKFFWVVWDDLIVSDDFCFDYDITEWDKEYIHVFKNGEHFDGICMFSKNHNVSNKEFHHRFFTNKKEIDTIASSPKEYNRFTPHTYEEYQQISDEMFWIVWPEVVVTDARVFDLYFSHHNSYDRRENHVFKNKCNNIESYLSGIVLCSKYKKISKKEFEKQYLINKKEHDIVASRYRYPQYAIDSYEEYLNIVETETQPMFWCIWPEIEVIDNTIFDLYFDPNDGKYDYDRNINHVFQHIFRDELTYNGICLISKNKILSKKEIDFRFPIEKKMYEIVASQHKAYDIIFISYNEVNADDNFNNLISRFPLAKRIHGVKGIHNAHKKAAQIATTDMFFVVDGDAAIVDDFKFDYMVTRYERDIVHIWKSQNPINDLIYGYGGAKLLPRDLVLAMDINSVDMTTSISPRIKVMDGVSNTTQFNTDEFSTWKSAFRECVKLASKPIDKNYDEQTDYRLQAWCSLGADKPFGEYALAGARAGREYGYENIGHAAALAKINDFDWLQTLYEQRTKNIHS